MMCHQGPSSHGEDDQEGLMGTYSYSARETATQGIDVPPPLRLLKEGKRKRNRQRGSDARRSFSAFLGLLLGGIS